MDHLYQTVCQILALIFSWFGAKQGCRQLVHVSHRLLFAAVSICVLFAGCWTSKDRRTQSLLESGRGEYQARRFDQAEEKFRQVAREQPKNAEAHYWLGMALRRRGQSQNAMTELYQAYVLKPDLSDSLMQLAQLMVRSNDLQNVQWSGDHARRLLRNSNDPLIRADAFYVLGIGALRRNDLNGARQNFDLALEQNANHIGALSLSALEQADRGDVAGGEARLTSAITRDPRSANLISALAEFYRMAGKPAEAEALWRRVLVLDPSDAAARVNLVDLLSSDGREQEAEEMAQALGQLGGKVYRHWHALLLFRNGQTGKAAQELQQISSTDPQDELARLRYIAALIALERLPKAAALISSGPFGSARKGDVLLLRAQLLVKQKNLPAATSAAEEAMRFDAASGWPHLLMAQITELESNHSRSAYELGEALRLEPAFLPARLALIRRSIANQDLDAALGILDTPPENHRSSYPMLQQRVWTLLSKGYWSQASKVLEGISTVERSPEVLAQRALLESATKNPAAARARSAELLRLLESHDALLQVSTLLSDRNASNEQIRAVAAKLGSQPVCPSYGSQWLELPRGLMRSALDPERLLALQSFGVWEPMIDEF